MRWPGIDYEPPRWVQIAGFIITVALGIVTLLSLVGIADDVAAWGRWLDWIDSTAARVVAAVGLAGLVGWAALVIWVGAPVVSSDHDPSAEPEPTPPQLSIDEAIEMIDYARATARRTGSQARSLDGRDDKGLDIFRETLQAIRDTADDLRVDYPVTSRKIQALFADGQLRLRGTESFDAVSWFEHVLAELDEARHDILESGRR